MKSNAYGHGLAEVAHILDGQTLPFLCVDSYFEALILRNEGIGTPLLILGYTPLETLLKNGLEDVAFGIISIEGLRDVAASTSEVKIHLKLDTGMHRHGIPLEHIDEAVRLIRGNARITLEGLYSHFADADTPDSAHAGMQIKRWNDAVKRFRSAFPSLRYYHLSASSGISRIQEFEANVLRLGIGLYGINVSPTPLPLMPALEMMTRITSVRTLSKGESIGYNATFTAPRDMRVASIPAGYFEGVDRRLSNKGSLVVAERPCPIVGRVSMNITSLDVSKLPNARIGEKVIVISDDAAAPNSVEGIAKTCGTIPYEILVHIPTHLRRTVV